MTTTAFDAMKAKGFYDAAPYKGRELAIASLSMPAGDNSKGIRLGNYVSIRKEVADAISKVLFDNVPVQQALDDAAAHANAILRKYEQTYQGATLP